MTTSAESRFMKQQGFELEDEQSTKRHFKSLLFQPTIVGLLLLLAVLTQSPFIFIFLGVILWFNTLFPKVNPFERTYDFLIGKQRNFPKLPPAPPPRRFMQGMAGTLMLMAGFFVLNGWSLLAYITEVFIVVAFALLLFGKFCIGAYIFHILKGNVSFANSTCPWCKS